MVRHRTFSPSKHLWFERHIRLVEQPSDTGFELLAESGNRSARIPWPLVMSRIVELLDTPNMHRRLEKEISRQMKATANKTRDTKPLRQRIAELEKNIAKGVERLLLLDGEDLNDASRLLANWRQERRTLEEHLQVSEHKRNASPQREAARVAAELADLRETFAVADPATLRAALASVIEDITLYWTDGGPRKYRFQRGTIRFGGILRLLASCETTTSRASISSRAKKSGEFPRPKNSRAKWHAPLAQSFMATS